MATASTTTRSRRHIRARASSPPVLLFDGATLAPLRQYTSVGTEAPGKDVALGNDVDGDGFGDVAIQSPAEDDLVVPSGAEGAIRVLSARCGFGSDINFSRDFDSDGRNDVLAGFAGESGPGFTGLARIFSGPSGIVRSLVSKGGNPGKALTGAAFAISDLDADGDSDFVVGGGGNDDGGAVVFATVHCGGSASYFGGPTTGSPEGCTGFVGLQCGLLSPLSTDKLEAEGCIGGGGQAILYFSGGIHATHLMLIGVQTANAVLPGGCSLLVAPQRTIAFAGGLPGPLAFSLPLGVPNGTIFAQLISYRASPGGYNCLQMATSTGLHLDVQ